MNLEIRRQGIELTDEQRDDLTNRLSAALQRFEPHIETLTVYVSDLNGPKAGVDKRCRIQAGVKGGRRLMVEETGADLAAVIGQACERFGFVVRRDMER